MCSKLMQWLKHFESLKIGCYGSRILMITSVHRNTGNFIGNCHYSTRSKVDSSKDKFIVTIDNIFSNENKCRVQKSLLYEPQKQIRKVPKIENPRLAAVLVPLCLVNKQPSFLFMVRSREITKHKGEICFPGGMMDSSDPDLTYTAIRETHEEIGLPESCVDVWGHMNQIPSRDGSTLVTPVLATCGEIDLEKFVLNPHEAEEVFTCTISDLCHHNNVGSTQFRTGSGFTTPVFHCGKYRIWGLTAIFLHLTLKIIAPGLYQFKLRHRS